MTIIFDEEEQADGEPIGVLLLKPDNRYALRFVNTRTEHECKAVAPALRNIADVLEDGKSHSAFDVQ